MSINNNNSIPQKITNCTDEGLRYASSQFFSENYLKGKPGKNKKILGLTDPSGGGHETAMASVVKSLEGGCTTQVVRPFKDIPGEKKFNELQKQGKSEMLGLLTKMQRIAEVFICPSLIRPKIIKEIETAKPDMIISVVPLANFMTHSLASEKNIPLLVIPTDLKCDQFFHFVDNPGKNFYVGLAFEDENTIKMLTEEHGISRENILITGYPVRKGFEEVTEETKAAAAAQEAAIREELNIKEGEKMVIIMMGAQGMGDIINAMSSSLANYPGELPQKLHVVALCGGNEELKKNTLKVNETKTNPHVQIHALGIKNDTYLGPLYRMSHALITKPGGATVNEAFASETRVLFYSKYAKHVDWEMWNMNFAIKQGLGEEIVEDRFADQVMEAIQKPRPRIVSCPARTFQKNLREGVAKIFSASCPQSVAPAFSPHKFFETQSKSLNGNLSKIDQLNARIWRRETREGMDNLLHHPQIREVLRAIFIEKKLTLENMMAFYGIASLLQSGNEDDLFKILYTTDNKALLRKLENLGCRFYMKHFPATQEEFLKKDVHLVPQAIFSKEMADLIVTVLAEDALYYSSVMKTLDRMAELTKDAQIVEKFFTKQSELSKEKLSFKDKMYLNAVQRETKEAIYNLLHHPEVKTFLKNVFVNKQLTQENLRTLAGLTALLSGGEDASKAAAIQMLFTTENKGILRKIENYGIQRYLKQESNQETILECINYLPRALQSDEVLDTMRTSLEEIGIDLESASETLSNLMQNPLSFLNLPFGEDHDPEDNNSIN